MRDIVERTLTRYNMLNPSDKILVAFSGGCDSVSLCIVLMELGYDFAVAHVNHMIRKEAEHDEEFVVQFATRHNLVCHTTRIDVPRIAAEEKISIESAGRKARYEYFELLSKQFSYTKIAVAHNKNDSCETFLHNLFRGSGLGGLCGIVPVRGNIIRPIIEVDRKTIERYVAEKSETYVNDSTNSSLEYTRNRIRHAIMPQIAEINPNFMDNICNTMEIIRANYDYLMKSVSGIVEMKDGNAIIDKQKFMMLEESLKAYALKIAYTKAAGTSKDFESRHIMHIISEVTEKEHGKICNLCMNVHCDMQYGKIVFGKNIETRDYEYVLTPGKTVYVNEAGAKITASLISKNEVDYAVPDCEFFDFDKIPDEIIIRNRKSGDKIIPMGKKSHKKVKDILINKKITREKRNVLPIITSEEIMWIYGIKRGAVYTLDENTEKVLMIRGEKI